MKQSTYICFAIACLWGSIFYTPAFASGHKHHQPIAAISFEDKEALQEYLRDNYRPHCPPGLAKKHNGCLPPGVVKKYRMGEPLPEDADAQELPSDLLSSLHAVPGFEYVQVDHDVLLISEATKKVVDAVTLLSAVGK